MAALFIGVVLFFPQGLAGLYETYILPAGQRLLATVRSPRGVAAKEPAQ